MSGNAQGLIDSVGKALPIVFVLGLIGVALIAYGFIRLTRFYNHAGSAYGLVGKTVGPRAGFLFRFCHYGNVSFSFRLAHLRHWVHLPMLFWPHYSPPLVFRSHGLSLRQLE